MYICDRYREKCSSCISSSKMFKSVSVSVSVRANSGGAPKERRRGRAEKRLSNRVLLESPFPLCSLKVFRTFSGVLRENLKGAEKKRTLQKHPFGQPFLRTTPSPLLWRALKFPQKMNFQTFPRCNCKIYSDRWRCAWYCHYRAWMSKKHCYNLNLLKKVERSQNGFFAKGFLSQSVAKWQFEYDSAAHLTNTSWRIHDIQNTGQEVSQSVVKCRVVS